MNTGIKDGKLVIDMAEADDLWNGLTDAQRYEAMCIMFDPIMERATELYRAMDDVREAAEHGDSDACREIALKVLNAPKVTQETEKVA